MLVEIFIRRPTSRMYMYAASLKSSTLLILASTRTCACVITRERRKVFTVLYKSFFLLNSAVERPAAHMFYLNNELLLIKAVSLSIRL